MRADKAWQNTLQVMANNIEPVAARVRRCADQAEHVIAEAQGLLRAVKKNQGWCHSCSKNSTELWSALDNIALLTSGLGSLVAELYESLYEGVQTGGQEASKCLKDDFA